MKILITVIILLFFVWLVCKEYEVRCPNCGKKLKKVNLKTTDGKTGEFWYCENCRFKQEIWSLNTENQEVRED